MKRHDADLDRVLDRAIAEIRDEEPDSRFAEGAIERAWQGLAAASAATREGEGTVPGPRPIESCRDFQALLPSYLDGRVDDSRRLLLKDHLGECVTCRREYKKQQANLRAVRVAPAEAGGRRSWATKLVWRVAAAAVVFIGLIGISVRTDVFTFETGGLIRIEAVEGELFRVGEDGTTPIQAGETLTLEEGEGIRTAKGSSAVLALADASKVEMRERSELAVYDKRSFIPGLRPDGVIDLARGSVIVEASEQGSGHLNVRTTDCDVAVKGTVFSVSHGVKGSRVSVIEGEVRVDHSGAKDVLLAGQQATTGSNLQRVPVAEDIAWSRNSEQYVELLKEMQALTREIDEAFQPGLRYSTELLDLAPADSAIFFAMPNVSEELAQAYGIFKARMDANPVLRHWWDEQMSGADQEDLERVLDKVAAFGGSLGEEIVMTLQVDGGGNSDGPLFLAHIDDPGSFRMLLETEMQALEEQAHAPTIHLFEGELATMQAPQAGHGDDALYLWVVDGVLAAAPNFSRLATFDAVRKEPAKAALSGSAFYDRLAELYRDGVEWSLGVDLQRLIRQNGGPQDSRDSSEMETLESLGLLDVQHVTGERKQVDGRTENRAVITFDQPRRNLAAWLAEPAPIGALDYVSPEASLVVAFAMKDMATLVEDLFELVGKTESDFRQHLDEFERSHGIDVRQDIASPLGGEFAMALDGPVLPTPAWKLIIEVYDSARLQQTLEWMVEQINGELTGTRSRGLSLQLEQVGSREYHRLESLDTGLEAHYTFDGAYVLFGPSRAMVDRALKVRDSGIRLTDSPNFVELLPRDGEVSFSGAFYHNLGPILGPLSRTLSGAAAANLSPESARFVQQMAAESKPALALLYGERDRIVFTSTSEGGLFSSGLGSISGVGGLLGMQQSLIQTLEEQFESQ